MSNLFPPTSPDMKPYGMSTRHVVLIALVGLVLTLLFWQHATLRNGVAGLLENQATHRYGPLLFIALYACRPVLLLPASLLTVSAGLLFGPWLGVFYTAIGSNLAAALAYLLGRYGGRLLPTQLPERLERAKTRMRTHEFVTVLSLRLLFTPHDLVSYLAGGMKLNYLSFALATLLGTLPVTIILVFVGVATDTVALQYVNGAKWLLIGLVVTLLSYVALRRGLNKEQMSQG